MRALVRDKGAVQGGLNNTPLLVGHGLRGRILLEEQQGLNGIPLLIGHGHQLCLRTGRNRHGGYATLATAGRRNFTALKVSPKSGERFL